MKPERDCTDCVAFANLVRDGYWTEETAREYRAKTCGHLAVGVGCGGKKDHLYNDLCPDCNQGETQ